MPSIVVYAGRYFPDRKGDDGAYIDAARSKWAKVIFKDWPQDELMSLFGCTKFADAMDSDSFNAGIAKKGRSNPVVQLNMVSDID